MSSSKSDLFRNEALEHHAAALGRDGEVLRIHPGWIRPAYWLLLTFMLTAAVVAVVMRVHQYASGPAFVRVDGRTVLTAVRAGTVIAVSAEPGKTVRGGQVLARLDDSAERVALDGVQREIEIQTRALLLDLTDGLARRELAVLQAQRMRLEGEIDNRLIRAPHDGTINDVRVRVSQHVAPGNVVLSLTGKDATFSVIALLPGHVRPQIEAGAPLRLEMSGYRYSYQRLTIESIGDEVLSPLEARRLLGPDIADAIPLSGPVVLVRAQLPQATFVSDDRTFHFFDGMPGTAETRVRSESILVALLPGLRSAVSFLHE